MNFMEIYFRGMSRAVIYSKYDGLPATFTHPPLSVAPFDLLLPHWFITMTQVLEGSFLLIFMPEQYQVR